MAPVIGDKGKTGQANSKYHGNDNNAQIFCLPPSFANH